MADVLIAPRFNGPPSSANGGYAAGAIAEAARTSLGWDGDVTVRLTAPPPLGVPLELTGDGGTAQLRTTVPAGDGSADQVAAARHEGPATWTPPVPVGLDEARAVEPDYPGLRAHPFPTCFSCGPGRAPGDGLRIFPGRVAEGRVAASWTPDAALGGADGRVGVPVAWAALDCVGGWSSDLEHRPLVLAEMCARVESLPEAGTAHVVVGTLVRTEGRKTWTASAMFDGDRLVGRAEQLWVAVDWAVVQHLQQA